MSRSLPYFFFIFLHVDCFLSLSFRRVMDASFDVADEILAQRPAILAGNPARAGSSVGRAVA
jgi:hypothetical protein